MKIRPHHGVCIQFFEGIGYSEDFVHNMTEVIAGLDKEQNQKLVLCSQMDPICKSCPNNLLGVCTTQEKVERYDRLVLQFCGYEEGDCPSWETFQKQIWKKILHCGKLGEICSDCGWYSICSKKSINKLEGVNQEK